MVCLHPLSPWLHGLGRPIFSPQTHIPSASKMNPTNFEGNPAKFPALSQNPRFPETNLKPHWGFHWSLLGNKIPLSRCVIDHTLENAALGGNSQIILISLTTCLVKFGTTPHFVSVSKVKSFYVSEPACRLLSFPKSWCVKHTVVLFCRTTLPMVSLSLCLLFPSGCPNSSHLLHFTYWAHGMRTRWQNCC